MEKKKSLMVSINGNETKIYDVKQTNRSHDTPKIHTYDNVQNDNHYESSVRKKTNKSSTSFYHMKPLLIAIISAIGIGSLLGFLMLFMFTGVGSKTPESLPAVTNNEENNDQNKQEENEEKGQINIEELKAFVLQGGVFSEIDNAEQWANFYEDAGFPTMIWGRDGQFYLLAGITTTRDKGKGHAEKLFELDIDIFVKEWFTTEQKIQLNQIDQEWVLSFQSLWKETLQSTSEDNIMLVDQWRQLLDRSAQTDKFRDFSSQLKASLEKESIKSDPLYQQQFLLLSWHKFEQAILEE